MKIDYEQKIVKIISKKGMEFFCTVIDFVFLLGRTRDISFVFEGKYLDVNKCSSVNKVVLSDKYKLWQLILKYPFLPEKIAQLLLRKVDSGKWVIVPWRWYTGLSDDVITRETCFSMFVYIPPRFGFALIGGNLTAQSTEGHREIGVEIQVPEA